jgi:hypothetical protein
MKSMNYRKIGLLALWAASLLLVAQWGHTQTAQTQTNGLLPGAMITGDEIGFRLQGFSGTPGTSAAVTGQWMVKLNGNWTPVQAPGVSLKPLTER